MNSKNSKKLLSKLSPRQLEVVIRVCKGYSYPAIAKELFFSLSSVKNHMTAVYEKLDLSHLSKDDRKFQLRLVYCPLLQEIEETLSQEQPAQKSEPEMETAPITSEEEIIDSDEEEIITITPKPKNGGKEKMGTGKGRRRLKLILVLIAAALLVFGGWQGLRWFSKTPTGSSASAYEIREWHKEDDVWIQLADYEVTNGLIRLDFEIWNKTDQDLYFSWSPEQNFSMVDNENNRYDVFEASTREVTVGKDERLKFTGHGYSTVQFNDDPLYNSGVTDLYVTMEYLSKFDKATFHISVGN
jgi:DNA-binding CsgD family transcriptional regulator